MTTQHMVEDAAKHETASEWDKAARLYAESLSATATPDAELLFRLGHALFHQNELGEAAHHIERAISMEPNQATWRYRLAYIEEKLGRLSSAVQNYEVALTLEPARARWGRRLEATRTLHAAAAAEMTPREKRLNDPVFYAERLSALKAAKGQKWQELEILHAGRHAHRDDPQWLAQLGSAQYAMKRFPEAAESFKSASDLDGGNADWYFYEGHASEQAGMLRQAKAAYEQAVRKDKKLKADRFGIGVFFQHKGMWPAAAKKYQELAILQPSDAELRYRIGLAYDRCYMWKAAASHYQHAIVLDSGVPYWHYKLGFSYERQDMWFEAAGAYAHAHHLDSNNRYWSYRAGYAFESAGEAERACESYVLASPLPLLEQYPNAHGAADEAQRVHLQRILNNSADALARTQSKDSDRRRGELAAKLGMWDQASDAFELAAARSEDFDSTSFCLLGYARYRNGDYIEAAAAFREARLFKTSDGIDVEKYLKNKSQKLSMEYVEYYETLDLNPKTILWESNHGASIGCHPLAIFDEVSTKPEFADYRHVWTINNTSNIPPRLRERKNVIFVRTHSDLYKRHLASAQFLVNNVSFPPYFIRKQGQQYLNTWHGTPLKTLGKDMAGGPIAHANIARNFLQASHIISPNRHTSEALIERHDIAGIFGGKIAVTGSPRIDSLVRSDPNRREELRTMLGIALDDDKPIVLYAPTWRGASDDRFVDATQLQTDLKAMQSSSHHLFFRAHRLTEGLLEGFDAGQSVVPGDIDTNDLLIAVDVLITDYSSIFFDFLSTGRPIIFYAYDLEEYSRDRGLYFDIKDMPGRLCTDRLELAAAVCDSVGKRLECDGRYRAAQETYCPLEDGRAAARVARFFFEDDPDDTADKTTDTKTPILFHHGLIPNGIATSFANLMSSLDPEVYRIVLIVEPHVLAANPGRLEKLRALPEHVQVIGRVGVQAVTPEEKWVTSKIDSQFNLPSDAQWAIYEQSFRREYQRILAGKQFDSVIEFDGYAAFWSALIAFGASGSRKCIYLHNDMVNEYYMKFPNLEIIFGLYRSFDRLISVSSSVSNENRAGLAEIYGLDPESFTYSNNQIDADAVISLASEPLDADVAAWYGSAEKNFLAIGRLSPEKDHEKLIRAFVRFRAQAGNVNLIIVGDGPLRIDLEHLIERLNASSFIWLAGQRANPYPAILSADSFVLPSLHEGQPMVLFEAMILGRPIVCTDMPGPRDVLQNQYGLIVENSEAGVLLGLESVDSGDARTDSFDHRLYMDNAREQFLENVLPASLPR
ncbi:CDP-glycerol glycerophosphotransferase family protein [Arthrobacter sp. A5]|uniref:CDP-glycerol glycerophosphotransferase family protein n=1 Tax=Arthrobacter sp. A5 TaxID=576926 RepID=UPI003DA9DE58